MRVATAVSCIAASCLAIVLAACSKGEPKETAGAGPYVASEEVQQKVERIVRRSAADPKARVMVTKETAAQGCGFVSTNGEVVRFLADFGDEKAYFARGSSADDSIVAAKC